LQKIAKVLLSKLQCIFDSLTCIIGTNKPEIIENQIYAWIIRVKK